MVLKGVAFITYVQLRLRMFHPLMVFALNDVPADMSAALRALKKGENMVEACKLEIIRF